MPVKFWHTSLRFCFFLSYLITTVLLKIIFSSPQNKLSDVNKTYIYRYQKWAEVWTVHKSKLVAKYIARKCSLPFIWWDKLWGKVCEWLRPMRSPLGWIRSSSRSCCCCWWWWWWWWWCRSPPIVFPFPPPRTENNLKECTFWFDEKNWLSVHANFWKFSRQISV